MTTEAASAQMITAKPSDSAGSSTLHRMLSPADRTTASSTLPLFFAGGIIMAMNIPYSISDSAAVTRAGMILPAAAPSSVPPVQPMKGVRISPYIYGGVTGSGWTEATAKISSVTPKAAISRCGSVKLLSSRCDSERLIRE